MKNLYSYGVLYAVLSFFLFLNFTSLGQCPASSDCVGQTITIDVDNELPVCGVGTANFLGDIQQNLDCDDGTGLNCFEYVLTRAPGSSSQQFTVKVGQGNSCNGELDMSYISIDGVCTSLSSGGSQTEVTFTFPVGINEMVLYLCVNSNANVSICDGCKEPPPCDPIATCLAGLSDININGCDPIPAPMTIITDLFDVDGCDGTTLQMTSEDEGDTDICTNGGANFKRTYTLSFLDADGVYQPIAMCEQQITKTPPTLELDEDQVDICVSLLEDPPAYLIDLTEYEEFGFTGGTWTNSDGSSITDPSNVELPVGAPAGTILTYNYTFDICDECPTTVQLEVVVVDLDEFACAILPVELTNFSGEFINFKEVELTWVTESEINNDRFEVQRKFEYQQEFETVGVVSGAGDSSTLREYKYSDIGATQDKVYYRIKQVDSDGSFTFSEVIHLKKELDENELMISSTGEEFVLTILTADQNFAKRVQIFDTNGKVLEVIELPTIGQQQFQQLYIQTDSFSRGMFFINVEYMNGKRKVVKAMK